MPDDQDAQENPGLYLLIGATLLLMLIVALFNIHRRFTRRAPSVVRDNHVDRMFIARDDIPHSLRRGPFSAPVRREVNEIAARHQVDALRPYGLHGTTANAHNILENEILSNRRPEFQVRHVLADNFLRRSVVAALRMRDDGLAATIREVFESFGSAQLLNMWDTAWAQARVGGNWFHAIGRNGVRDLRRALNDVRGDLYLSEHQSNVAAGTNVDVTPDALALLGEPTVNRIVDRGVRLMHQLGLEPRLVQVQNEIMLGYSGSAGAFYQFGFDHRRTRDMQVDPLTLVSEDEARQVWENTPPRLRLAYAFRVRPLQTIAALILLFVLAAGAGLSIFRGLR